MSEQSTPMPSENSTESKLQLPPLPTPIHPWSDFDKEHFQYSGEMNDFNGRMKHKLYSVWQTYGQLCNNQKLIDYINKEEHHKNGEKHFLKNTIVNIVDRLSKILTNTDIMEELRN